MQPLLWRLRSRSAFLESWGCVLLLLSSLLLLLQIGTEISNVVFFMVQAVFIVCSSSRGLVVLTLKRRTRYHQHYPALLWWRLSHGATFTRIASHKIATRVCVSVHLLAGCSSAILAAKVEGRTPFVPSRSPPSLVKNSANTELIKSGELQAFYSDGDAGGLFIVHHAYRIPDQHPGMGARRIQIYGLH